MTVLIGCDPELFVQDKRTGEFLSCHDFIPGNKAMPVEIPFGAIQVDGVAAEFNIQPAGTRKEFLHNIKRVQTILEIIVRNKNPDYQLVASPTVKFKPEYFYNLPDEVRELGCNPDYDAYTGKVNPKPNSDRPMRTGSGHIHVGFTKDVENCYDEHHVQRCTTLVKELDFVLLTSSREWDQDTERREMYGMPGAFRPKPYGVEYRSLSNKWLDYDWAKSFIYDVTLNLTHRWLKGFSIVDKWNAETDKKNTFESFCLFLERNKTPSLLAYSPAYLSTAQGK